MGDYCVVVGTGLESHADDFMSLQSYYLENDFAAGEYDAGVKATFDAFIAWFADFYGVTIREDGVVQHRGPSHTGPQIPPEAPSAAAGGDAEALSAAGAGKRQI